MRMVQGSLSVIHAVLAQLDSWPCVSDQFLNLPNVSGKFQIQILAKRSCGAIVFVPWGHHPLLKR